MKKVNSSHVQVVDHKAFEVLVRQFHKRMLAFALTLDARADWAEDLVQEGFLIAFRDFDRFDPSRDFGAWLRGIIRNKYLERKKKRAESLWTPDILDAIETQYAAWDRAIEEGKSDPLIALSHCLDSLKQSFRNAVDLFYFKKLSCVDVAEKLMISEAAAKKRLQRSRESLADCINRKLGLEEEAQQ